MSFRVSEKEYVRLSKISEVAGTRSLSEYARRATMQYSEFLTCISFPMEEGLDLRRQIANMQDTIKRLASIVENAR